MSTYREIVGKKIKKVSSDPSDGLDGQMWYNSTTGTLRGLAITEAWSSSSNLVTAILGGITFGTQTAGSYVTGFSPSISNSNANQEYNGTGWSTNTNFPSSQTGSGGGAGPQTAGLVAGGGGGSRTADAFEYDGSSWTSTGGLPTAADNIGSCGTETQSNVIMAMGRIPSTGNAGNNTTAVYNGSTFSSGPNVGTGRMFGPGGGAGTGTAGLVFGGFIDPSPNAMTNTEQYDGSSWTAGGSLNNPSGLNCGWGTQTSAMAQCNPSSYKTFEGYDGTSWSSKPSTATGGNGYSNAAGASTPAGWITGLGPPFAVTEEFNSSTNTITAAAWASAPATNTALGTTAGCGSVTAGLVFSGADNLANSEKYDGTSWTATPTLNTGRYGAGEATNAPQTAALCFGGVVDPGTNNKNETEEWNGSSWSEQSNLPTGLRQIAGFGLQTAAVSIGGYSTTYSAESYEYNGSSWTAGGDMSTSRERAAGCGLETTGLAMGGNNPSPYIANVEEYDGSSWTNGTALPTATKLGSAAGIQTDAIFFAGNVPPNNVVGTTLGYDGTNWSTRPSMGTGRQAGAGAGTSTAALMMAGANVSGTALTTVEEFTGATLTANIENFTTS